MSDETINNDTPGPQDGVVQLVCTFIFKGNGFGVRCTMPAPKLPRSMAWHRGVLIDAADDMLVVEDIVVKLDGTVRVMCGDEEFVDEWDDTMRQRMLNDGWLIEHEWRYEIG